MSHQPHPAPEPTTFPAAARLPVLAMAMILTIIMSTASAISGYERGGTAAERLIFAAIALIASVSAHIIPALASAKTRGTLPAMAVWLALFLVVAFGHAHFFTTAEISSGAVRASVALGVAPGVAQPGRAPHEIAAEISRETAALSDLRTATERWRKQQHIAALRQELATAREAQARADRAAEDAKAAAADPLGSRIASLIGMAADGVMLVVAILTALALECCAVILWWVGLDNALFRRDSESDSGDARRDATATPRDIEPVAEYPEAVSLPPDHRVLYRYIREHAEAGRIQVRTLKRCGPESLRPAVDELLIGLEAHGLITQRRESNGGKWVVLAGEDKSEWTTQRNDDGTTSMLRRLRLVNGAEQ